jgi:formate--tetrahydrofolate ligase
MAFQSEIIIAQAKRLQYIKIIAKKLQIAEDDLEMYGKYKAQLPLSLIEDEKVSHNNLVLVTALTSTPAGEGKITVSIGLAEGLNKIRKQAIVVLREPSLGPVFGIKGGAAEVDIHKFYRWKTLTCILWAILIPLKKRIIC